MTSVEVRAGGHSKQLWLSPDVLQWERMSEGGHMASNPDTGRVWAHWRHAESLAQPDASEFERIDLVTTLKRAMDIRLRRLRTVYDFKRIPVEGLPKGTLELLEALGLVRPRLLRELLEIRNRIEHQDFEPPTIGRCLEMLDIVWYFLTATDGLVRMIPSGVAISPSGGLYDDAYGFVLSSAPPQDWSLRCRGHLPAVWVSTEACPGWIRIAAGKCEQWSEHPPPSPKLLAELPDYAERIRNRQPDDWSIEGVILGPRDVHLELYRALLTSR